MKNIFENVKWGDVFKTSNGRKAIFLGYNSETNNYMIVLDDLFKPFHYLPNGNLDCEWKRPKNGPHPLDVVSEWQEPINEEELDKLAKQNNPYEFYGYYETRDSDRNHEIFNEGFKAGYHKALEKVNMLDIEIKKSNFICDLIDTLKKKHGATVVYNDIKTD